MSLDSQPSGFLSRFESIFGRKGKQAVSALVLASALDSVALPGVADAALTKDPIVASDSDLKSSLTGPRQELHAPGPRERLMNVMVEIQRLKALCTEIPESTADDAVRSRLASLDTMSIDKYRTAYSRAFGIMSFVAENVSDEEVHTVAATLEEFARILASDMHACGMLE